MKILFKYIPLLCFILTTQTLALWPGTSSKVRPYESYSKDRWYHFYSQNNLDSARFYLEKRLQIKPRELPTLTFYAELLKRQEEYVKADSLASEVIKLNKRCGHAYCIKGDIRNRQYGPNEVNEKDNTGPAYYYELGLEMDPGNGNLWEVFIFQCLKEGDIERYYEGLQSLYKDGYTTKSALEFARLVLESCPPKAILLCGGDTYTYSLLAAQGGGVRTDVVILNTSLLNLPWYFEEMSKLGKIEHGLSSEEIAAVTIKVNPDKSYETIATQFIRILNTYSKKSGRKLLCMYNTANTFTPKELLNKTVTIGPVKEIVDTLSDSHVDFNALETYMRNIDPTKLQGSYVSHLENSPIILNLRNKRTLDSPLLYPLAHYAYALHKKGDLKGIEEIKKCYDTYFSILEVDEKTRTHLENYITSLLTPKK